MIDDCTPRQVEIWRLHHRGRSSTQIALELGIARHTVRNHLKAMSRFVESANQHALSLEVVRQERGGTRCVRLVVEEVV